MKNYYDIITLYYFMCITHVIPKPMIPILQKPVMEFLLELLREHNFKEIMVNVSHLAEEIENYAKLTQ